jgi:hypothetical protein
VPFARGTDCRPQIAPHFQCNAELLSVSRRATEAAERERGRKAEGGSVEQLQELFSLPAPCQRFAVANSLLPAPCSPLLHPNPQPRKHIIHRTNRNLGRIISHLVFHLPLSPFTPSPYFFTPCSMPPALTLPPSTSRVGKAAVRLSPPKSAKPCLSQRGSIPQFGAAGFTANFGSLSREAAI